MSNIILDEGKKVIPDLTWSPDGRDMLFILENGGGKTSVIQLIMQTILPNATLTGRKIKETVAKRSSGHIATSWRLDGDNPKYAVFGFSYINANSDSEDLQYFNYYFTHSDDSPLTIETLPMVVDGKLTTFAEYKRILQRVEGVRVQIPETNEQYRTELQQFQILVEEWKNMQKINGDEGGVAEFFEKAKTVEDLIKKLLIPSIEDTIFKSKEDIYESFQGLKENLLKIPELKQDLQDFRIIQENAGSVIHSVEQYKKTKRLFFSTQTRFIELRKTFDQYKEELLEVKETLEQAKQELQTKQKEWKWIQDSFAAHQTKQEMLTLQKEWQDYQEKVAEQIERVQTATQNYKETKALHHYDEWNMYKREKQTYQAELNAFELSHADLMKQVEEAKRAFHQAWHAVYKELKQREKLIGEELCQNEGDIRKAKQMLALLRDQGNEFTKESASLEAKLAQYEKELSALEREMGYEAMRDAAQFIQTCKEEIEENAKYIADAEQKIETWEEQKSKKAEFVQEKKLYIAECMRDKQSEETLREQYQTDKERVQTMLLQIGKPISRIWDEQDELMGSVQKQLEHLIRDKEKLVLTVQKGRERVEDLRAYDYFVPHKTLLKIKEELERNRIYVVLGSEWLSQQTLNEMEKENILENNRLLPYSILVEEGQIKQIERVLRNLKGERFEIPILFQVKEQVVTSLEVDMPVLMSMQHGVMVFQPLETKLFASRDEMQRILEEEESRLQESTQNLKQYKEQEQILQTVLREMKSFYQTYDNGFDNRVKRCIDSVEEQMARAEEEIEEIYADISFYEQQIADRKEKRKQYENEKYLHMNRLEKVDAFLKRFPDIQSVKDQYAKAQTALLGAEKEIKLVEQMGEEARETNTKLQRLANDHQHRLHHHEHLRNTYGFLYESCEGDVIAQDGYEEVKIAYEQLNKRMEQESGSFEHIQKLLTAAQRNENKEQEEIDKLGVALEWLDQHKRSVTETEVEQAESVQSEAKALLHEIEKECTGIEKQAYGKELQWKTECDAMVRTYGKEPYVYGDDAKKKKECTERALESSYQEERNLEKQSHENEEELGAVLYTLEGYKDIAYLPVYTEQTKVLSKEEWKSIHANPKEAFRKQKRETETAKLDYEQQTNLVRRTFKQYLDRLEMTHNPKVKTFADQLMRLLDGEKLYDYDFIHGQFQRIFESLTALKQQHEHMLIQSEQDKEALVNSMYDRILAVYENIKEMPRHARIQLYNMPIEMIKMDWKREEEETTLQNLRRWMDTLLRDVQEMHQSGKHEEDINLYMRQQLRTEKMLECLAPIHTCQIKVFKPRKQTLMESGVDYEYWHKAAKWSGGEQYTSYMTMFMVLITHIRKKRFAKENSWKFIIADNPFGKASSEHVVSPIIELANKSNIQLMCLTAIKEEGLRKHFDVVTSNRYYHMGGKEILSKQEQTTSLKSLYYKKPAMI
uniref:hypothetical protein n=1 Tax=Bacillus cytotoxicus TaxID=580165 RepID=UPI0020403C12